jgi:HPt (histidine-containing phosphotransfer) domain-containing protein
MDDANGKVELSVKEEQLKKKISFLNEDLGEETVIELSKVYIESTDEIIIKLNNSFETGNYQEIRNLVHSLRGNSGTFGFEPLVAACKELELSIADNKTEPAAGLLEIVISEVKENVLLLKKLLGL